MNNSSLQALLGAEVLELTFVRRHPKLGWSNIRGMFGTTNFKLLNGDFGKYVLYFKPPKGVGMGYDYKAYNLCVVWDIFRQEYRVFGAEQVNVRQRIKVGTDGERAAFMDYFADKIQNISNDDKLDFIGYTGDFNIVSSTNKNLKKQGVMSKLNAKAKDIGDRIKGFFKKK